MAIEFTIHIDPQQIRIQDPQTGYKLEMLNLAWIQPREKLLLALGEPEDKARARLRGRRMRPDTEIYSSKLFGASGAELFYEIQAFQFFTRLLLEQLQRAGSAGHFVDRLTSSFDYALEISGYEAFPEARRSALEHSLQARLPIRRLAINGQPVQIARWRRILEAWLRRVLCQALPILAILAGYLFMPRAFAGSWLSFFLFLMVVGYLSYYGGRLLWMVAVRRLVPRDYCLSMLQGTHKQLAKIDQWLAQLAWGVPRSE